MSFLLVPGSLTLINPERIKATNQPEAEYGMRVKPWLSVKKRPNEADLTSTEKTYIHW